ncbi:transmembrane protein [Achlya hypogyna]|uniref:Transmembrane protein n=1 Tax=Achlya hypogyna TaxID=1202772 RepID=A0A1V9YHC3_ACHHY|nr:transmembrane protein [Achlya hypogyna]
MAEYPSMGEYDDYPRKSSECNLEGAIRPGGALNLASAEAVGVLGQYVAVGTIYEFLPALGYPVFTQYLNFNGYEVASYATLVNISWSLKVFMGILTDCFPLFGLKRKPYMLVGWTLCISSMCFMACRPFPAPFFSRELASALSPQKINAVRGGDYGNLTEAQVASLNPGAKDSALYYILLSAVASLGYVLADVAADAMAIQYAQREPIAVRGRLQATVYGTRFAASLAPHLLTAFCLNTAEFGGDFNWSISINVLRTGNSPVWRHYVSGLWKLLQLRVMWQICAYRFLSNLCYYFDATVSNLIPEVWAHVEPLTSSWFGVLNTLLTSGCLFALGKWGVNLNWRSAIALSTVAVVAIDSSILFCTTWNVIRDPYFFVGGMTPDTFPSAVRFLISAYCAVEIADMGNEGVVQALVTTIVNLADPFATVLYKYIDSFFDTNQRALARDSTSVRWQVMYVLLIAFGMQLASLWLKKRGGSHVCAAYVITTGYVLTLLFSISTNIMSLYPSTSCLRIAGGDGQPIYDSNHTRICG